MKKIFTLLLALVGITNVMNAATVDDLTVCKHSYVFVADDYTNNGTVKTTKGSIIADGFFFCVTGNSVATNKQSIDLSEKDDEGNYKWLNGKYAEYGKHLNSLRLKNAQDVVALKVTAGSKVIVLGQSHASRYALFNEKADMTGDALGDGAANSMIATYTATDDMTLYIGSKGGDYYISYIIVEANEPVGTPSVKVGAQTYQDGLYFREVTCTPAAAEIDGESYPTLCTYTTDGSTPNEKSPVYTEPIKCYSDQTIKFQAYLDFGEGAAADNICEGAENEGIASFSFNAPTIAADGATFTVTSEYEGAKNYISYGNVKDEESNGTTLTESATVTAYSVIQNGSYGSFTTKSTTKDVYALNPIKEEKTISVTAGAAVVDEAATATSTTGTVYVIEGGEISADKADFFVKDLTFAALANADAAKAKYQVPAGQEAYIQMSNTNISFLVADGDSVDVTVTCSKNSCKTINAEEDESVTTDRKCYVSIDGTTYGCDDITNGDVNNLDGYQNVIKFRIGEGVHTFVKYSGTGNILISSINFKPAAASVYGDVNGDGEVGIADANAIIAVICGGSEYADKADVTGNGEVGIEDVNEVITIICGGSAAK